MTKIIQVSDETFEKIKDQIETPKQAESKKGLNYCIVRTYSAGVFAGWLKELDRPTQTAVVLDARRIWYWSGSASLSELAVKGVGKPEECKFPVAVESIELLQVIEVIPCTEKAKESIKNVKEWTAI